MFRVTGRDARGASHVVSVAAATEAEARALVLGEGLIVAIDRVTVPPPAPPRVRLRLGGRAVTLVGCALCLLCLTAGALVGGLVGHELDVSSGDFLRFRWVTGGLVGATLGLAVGVGTFVAFLKRFWDPR